MKDPVVNLVDVVDFVHGQLTDALCDVVWRTVRTRERVRLWTLGLLMRFWVDVVAFTPRSLGSAFAEGQQPGSTRYRGAESSPQAFFKRCQRLSPEMAAEVFRRFRAGVVAGTEPSFERDLLPIRKRFTAIEAVDASDLDQVRRRLKTLWRDARVPLAGMILSFYDICSGTIRDLVFEPHVGTSEFRMAEKALEGVAPKTLLVGDRLYGVPKFLGICQSRNVFFVGRLFDVVQVKPERILSRRAHPQGGEIEDREATIGSGQTTEPQKGRVIRWRDAKGRIQLTLVTTVLDPKLLSAEEAMKVYRARWKVERLFSDLKGVLSLKRFYAANTNAIALQLYATAILHTAMRVGQANVARQAKVDPETLSTTKLYACLARLSWDLAGWELGISQVVRLNPGVTLQLPDRRDVPGAQVTLSRLLAEERKSRSTRPRLKPSFQWRSLPRAPSFPKPKKPKQS